jgi:DNA polymerase-3 subunit beta
MHGTLTKTADTIDSNKKAIAIAATVSAQALRNAVNTVYKNSERGVYSSAPILNCINLRLSGGKMTVAKYGIDLQISTEINATGSGNVAIPAKPLAAFLTAVDGDTVDIRKNADAGAVSLSCGGWSVSIFTMDPDDAPDWKTMPPAKRSFDLAEGVLQWLFKMTGPFISTEETRYYLNGICFELEENTVRVIATDGHRLGTRETATAAPLHGWTMRPIVPIFAVTALQGIVADKEVSVSFHTAMRVKPGTLTPLAARDDEYPTHAVFTAGGYNVATKLIDGTFPDWRRVVPSDVGRVSIDIDVKKVGQFAKITAGFSNNSRAVSISPAEDGIRLESKIDAQDITGFVAGDRSGDFEKFGVNVRYLKELSASFGSKIVKAMPNGAGDPIIFTAPDSPKGEFAILMPMRV